MKSCWRLVVRLEEFARAYQVSNRWVSLRRECEALVSNPSIGVAHDMQNPARILARYASEILHARWQTVRNETFYAATK